MSGEWGHGQMWKQREVTQLRWKSARPAAGGQVSRAMRTCGHSFSSDGLNLLSKTVSKVTNEHEQLYLKMPDY